jgi:hypothetical protein
LEEGHFETLGRRAVFVLEGKLVERRVYSLVVAGRRRLFLLAINLKGELARHTN